jgi:hypothetical protein
MPKTPANPLIVDRSAKVWNGCRSKTWRLASAKHHYCLIVFADEFFDEDDDVERHPTGDAPARFQMDARSLKCSSHYEFKGKRQARLDAYLDLGAKTSRVDKLKSFQRAERLRSNRARLPGYKLFHQEKILRDPDPIGTWFRQYAGSAAKRVEAFCEAQGIVTELRNSVALAEKCFQPFAVHLEEDIDPETDDRKILIALSIRGKTRQEVLAAYRDFRRQMIQVVPRSKSTFIRLSYDIS